MTGERLCIGLPDADTKDLCGEVVSQRGREVAAKFSAADFDDRLGVAPGAYVYLDVGGGITSKAPRYVLTDIERNPPDHAGTIWDGEPALVLHLSPAPRIGTT